MSGLAKSARAVLLAGLACCAVPLCAEEAGAPSQPSLKPIVVTGKKTSPQVPDAVLKERVETTMRADPYFFDDHVTVTVKDGVVILEGLVFDAWDIVTATRIARRIPGVKRVFNDIELADSGD
ncbi:MAG: BON domain-containing protein [Steroidobacteraceae bacterium]